LSILDVQPDLLNQILVRFLREEAGCFGFKKAVLGLSGGVDSAVSCALAAQAFGPENVLAVMMPYTTSHPDSLRHAHLCADALGVRKTIVPIGSMVDGYAQQEGIEDATRRGNVMARARMVVLYDQSAAESALVIGTSNKTEMLLGYSTQFGDGASALNPLGDIYKHQVFQLARHLKLPAEIVDKPPSADLFEGQSDEADLGFSYAQADEALYRMVEERWSMEELLEHGFERKFLDTLQWRVTINHYKRLPPIIAKVTSRSFLTDFRYLRCRDH
jgi:NAD+ synthase